MKFHPYAEVFPLIDGDEFDALVEDIKAHGLREPIWRYKKQILDGRNRFMACDEAGVAPKFRDFKGTDDQALAFVVSANMARRHLSFEQRAMAAARIATLRKGDNQHTARAASSQSDAAKKLGVSTDSVQRARKVVESGSKALQQAVESGEVALKKAAAVVDLPKSEQLAAATQKPSKPEVDDDRWEPEEDEEANLAQAEKEYTDSIEKVMAADDKLAAAHAEIKRQAAEIAALKVSRDGYLNGKNAVSKLLKKEQARAAALSKKLDKANADIEKLRERIAIMETG